MIKHSEMAHEKKNQITCKKIKVKKVTPPHPT